MITHTFVSTTVDFGMIFWNFCSLQMDYPKDSDMMEVFECQKTQTNKYVALTFACDCP